MIEADSSLSPSGNEYFAGCALDEFLYTTTLKRPDLVEIQKEILEHIYIDIEGSKNKKINTTFLKEFAEKLKRTSGSS